MEDAIKTVLSIDFETANGSRTSACAVGAILLDFKTREVVERYSSLINPNEDFSYRNIMVHSITKDDVFDAPCFGDVADKLYQMIQKSSMVVAHNASFDMNVLIKSSEKVKKHIPDFLFIDTLCLSRKMMPELENHKLTTISEKLNLGFFQHHCAEDDAEMCGKVFISLCEMKQVSTIDEIINQIGVQPGFIHNGEYHKCSLVEKTHKNTNEYHAEDITDGFHNSYREEIDEQFVIEMPGRVPLTEIIRQPNSDTAFYEGYIYYHEGDIQRQAENYSRALRLLDCARYIGYALPSLYIAYAKLYRKLGDFDSEIEILQEAINRGIYVEKANERKERAEYLKEKMQEKKQALHEKEKRAEQKMLLKMQKEIDREKKYEQQKLEKAHTGTTKQVIQESLIGEFIAEYQSVSEAAKMTNINVKCIRDTVKGRQKSAGGFCWKLMEDQ